MLTSGDILVTQYIDVYEITWKPLFLHIRLLVFECFKPKFLHTAPLIADFLYYLWILTNIWHFKHSLVPASYMQYTCLWFLDCWTKETISHLFHILYPKWFIMGAIISCSPNYFEYTQLGTTNNESQHWFYLIICCHWNNKAFPKPTPGSYSSQDPFTVTWHCLHFPRMPANMPEPVEINNCRRKQEW